LSSKGVKTIYTSYNDIKETKFDFVVLCNVLHEINIDEWLPTLNKIIESLTQTGSLIIIEARTLSKGEQIGKIGFLLLSEPEIQIMFGLKTEPISSKHIGEYQNITSVFIPKSDLNPVSFENLLKALDNLKENTITKIKKLRSSNELEKNSNKFGRQAAFLSQQHINAKLAIEHLQNNHLQNNHLENSTNH
jgi:hypothetical protein